MHLLPTSGRQQSGRSYRAKADSVASPTMSVSSPFEMLGENQRVHREDNNWMAALPPGNA